MPELTAIVTKTWIFFIFGDLLIIPCTLGYFIIDNVRLIKWPKGNILTVHDMRAFTGIRYELHRSAYKQRHCQRMSILYSDVQEFYLPGVYRLDCHTVTPAGDVYDDVAGVLY